MEIKVGGERDTSTSKVGLTTSGDRFIEVQLAVIVSRAVNCASSGEGSMVRESMDVEGVLRLSPDDFVTSSGGGSLWFRILWPGHCRSEDPVVEWVPQGPKPCRRWPRCGSDGNSRSAGGGNS